MVLDQSTLVSINVYFLGGGPKLCGLDELGLEKEHREESRFAEDGVALFSVRSCP